MRMEDANVRVYRFDERDIIATSLVIDPAINDSAVPVIWLDRTSVENFNAFSEFDVDLQLDDDKYEYWAYSGATLTQTVKVPNVGTFTVTTFTSPNYKSIDDKPSLLNTMDAGDSEKYNMILAWLQNFGNR